MGKLLENIPTYIQRKLHFSLSLSMFVSYKHITYKTKLTPLSPSLYALPHCSFSTSFSNLRHVHSRERVPFGRCF